MVWVSGSPKIPLQIETIFEARKHSRPLTFGWRFASSTMNFISREKELRTRSKMEGEIICLSSTKNWGLTDELRRMTFDVRCIILVYGDKLGWELHYFCVAFFVVEGITENCPETDLEETNLGTWLCLPFPSYDTRDLGRVEELFSFRFAFFQSFNLQTSNFEWPAHRFRPFRGSDHLTVY